MCVCIHDIYIYIYIYPKGTGVWRAARAIRLLPQGDAPYSLGACSACLLR